jgi:hypothetical protein
VKSSYCTLTISNSPYRTTPADMAGSEYAGASTHRASAGSTRRHWLVRGDQSGPNYDYTRAYRRRPNDHRRVATQAPPARAQALVGELAAAA